ncbi:hypothetical protein [Algoriphagus marinus]|uniref:hypothetical protein n=1 Tax=Algoriphagus marinus TaxID=1925762 RepID=UPI00094B874E|nr:hypothetical protein [Algoriphagus marinus]
MISKEKALEAIKSLPEEFSIEDLMEKLILLNKIEIGLDQAQKGQNYTSEQAKKMIEEWSK